MPAAERFVRFDKSLAKRMAVWPKGHDVRPISQGSMTGLEVRTERGRIVGRYFGSQYKAAEEHGAIVIYGALPTENSINWEDVNVG